MKNTQNILKLTAISLLLVGTNVFASKKTSNTEGEKHHHKTMTHRHRNTVTALNSQKSASQFAEAVKQNPELVEMLKTGEYTIFAPTNKSLVKGAMINPKSYIVSGKLTVSDLREIADNKTPLIALDRTELSVEHKEHHVYVNDMQVTRTEELRTPKGNVYLSHTIKPVAKQKVTRTKSKLEFAK
jgi:hypothetical protein